MAYEVERSKPILTSLKSVREVLNAKRPYLAESNNSLDGITGTLKVNGIVPWKTFQILVEKNTGRLNISKTIKTKCSGIIEYPDLLATISEILQDNGVRVGYVTSGTNDASEFVVGRADSTIYRMFGSLRSALLIGHTYNSAELKFNENLTFLVDHMNQTLNCETSNRNGDIKQRKILLASTSHDTDYEIVALERLIHVLVLNGLSWGFLQNDESIRVVKLISYHNGLEVNITKHFSTEHSVLPLVAACIESFNGRAKLKESPEITLTPIAIKPPSLMPLSSYERMADSPAKWWEVRKSSLYKYNVKLDNVSTPIQMMRGRLWKFGSLIESRSSSNHDKEPEYCAPRAVTFIIAPLSDHLMKHTASIIRHLNDMRLGCVPKLLAYAKVQHIQLLSFDTRIRPIDQSDFEDTNIENHAHFCLSELHHNGIMLCDIDASSLAVEVELHRRIKLVGFSQAKLVRNVPGIVREREHQQLGDLLLKLKGQ